MKRNPTLILVASFLLSALASASETRVDSTGGLSLVMTDETVEINPFTLGNPAGLALLPPRTRLDLSYEWLKQTIYISNKMLHLYGNPESLLNNTVGYHGLMVSLSPQWALQLDGDLTHTEFAPDIESYDQTKDRVRGLFRTAYDFGPFALGVSAQPGQSSFTYFPNLYNGNTSIYILSGEGTATGLAGTAGLLVHLPLGSGKDRFEIGGTAATGLGVNHQVDQLNLEVSSPVIGTANVVQTYNFQNILSWGPDLYIETKDFQAALIGRFGRSSVGLQRESDNPSIFPSIASFNSQDNHDSGGAGLFKLKSPLEKTLSLKSGLFFSFTSGDFTDYDQSGGTVGTGTHQNWKAQGGLGLEKEKSFTFGLQLEAQGATGSNSTPGYGTDYFAYKVELGGERWLSPFWAFRIGFVFENDLDRGNTIYQTTYIPITPGQRVITDTLNTGIGFQDTHFKADLMLWMGQPYLFNSPAPDAFGTQLGAQTAATLFI